MLTAVQLQTLKTAIVADATLNALPNNGDGAYAIAQAFNQTASPVFIVWRTNVSINQVGDNIVGTELSGLTSTNTTRLQVIIQLSPMGVNPSLVDRRAFFDDIFSGAGGAGTRARLLALWKRSATRVEALFATGTGTDATPATMTFEGALDYYDVLMARSM